MIHDDATLRAGEEWRTEVAVGVVGRRDELDYVAGCRGVSRLTPLEHARVEYMGRSGVA